MNTQETNTYLFGQARLPRITTSNSISWAFVGLGFVIQKVLMTRKLSFLFFFLSMSFSGCHSRLPSPFDKTKIVRASELNLTFSQRGIETDRGMIFLVGQNLRVLTAFKDGVQQWKAEVITKCGEPAIGKAEIRYIRVEGDKIYVLFGMHSFAQVLIATGEVECLGAD